MVRCSKCGKAILGSRELHDQVTMCNQCKEKILLETNSEMKKMRLDIDRLFDLIKKMMDSDYG